MKLRVRNCTYHLNVHRQSGELPVLLLLHGFMGSGRVFDHLTDRLTQFCNPVTLDLIGHGKSDKPMETNRFAVEEQIRDLHEIIRRLQVQDLYLHGYSMGGRLALRYALVHGDTLRGVVLESTNYGIGDAEHKAEREIRDEQRALQIEKDFEYFLKDWANLPLFNTGLTTPDDLRDTYISVQRKQDAYAMANSLRGFGTAQMPSVKKELPRLQLPVLLLAGKADEKYLPVMGEMHELISGSRLEIIPEAGHRVHLENPEAFCEQIKTFI